MSQIQWAGYMSGPINFLRFTNKNLCPGSPRSYLGHVPYVSVRASCCSNVCGIRFPLVDLRGFGFVVYETKEEVSFYVVE